MRAPFPFGLQAIGKRLGAACGHSSWLEERSTHRGEKRYGERIECQIHGRISREPLDLTMPEAS